MSPASPKRKRDRSPSLDTKASKPRLLDESDPDDHVESPRSAVTKYFDDLEIHSRSNQESVDAGTKQDGMAKVATRQLAEASILKGKPISQRRQQKPQYSAIDAAGCGNTSIGSPAKSLRSKSPPLTKEVSDEFWHDSEITGHDPDDPDDDGYGINGIGFRPTSAIAWSRYERRKQQLNDYKNREAQEARRRRSERRASSF